MDKSPPTRPKITCTDYNQQPYLEGYVLPRHTTFQKKFLSHVKHYVPVVLSTPS